MLPRCFQSRLHVWRIIRSATPLVQHYRSAITHSVASREINPEKAESNPCSVIHSFRRVTQFLSIDVLLVYVARKPVALEYMSCEILVRENLDVKDGNVYWTLRYNWKPAENGVKLWSINRQLVLRYRFLLCNDPIWNAATHLRVSIRD